jgi:competence protein ComEA
MSFDDFRNFLDEKLEQSNISLNSTQALVLAVLVILLIVGGSIYYFRSKPAHIKQDFYTTKSEKPLLAKEKPKLKKTLIVHVCGAVKNPGVLELKEGDRVVDAINLSGGATDEANLDALNLAAKLTDGQKVYVPKKGEQVSGNLAGVSENNSNETPLVNINTASAEVLDSLPGIGEVLAQRIIEYRESKGNFSSIEQLRNVEGIGPKKFDHLKDKVTVN